MPGRLATGAAEWEGDYEIQEIELALQREGYRHIAGIDEAGRGPLAGPVTAAAVILPEDCVIQGVTDSKQLTPKQRDRLYDGIQRTSIAVKVSHISNTVIDKVNILQATLQAMQDAVEQIVHPRTMCLSMAHNFPPFLHLHNRFRKATLSASPLPRHRSSQK